MSVLRTERISKQYPGCLALDQVTVSFESGKVNALLGKNGSGKSTLVKCFSGAIRPTSGSFYLDDEKLDFNSTSDANARGFATVYQEMSLVPSLTVAENIFLGRMPKKGGVIDWKKANEEASRLLNKMGVNINPREVVSRLSMWQCQVVEITKAMSFNPKVLMLDEPTSSLATNEVECLFNVIRELKKQDIIILYISHKLHEVPQITDTITVLRDGQFIGKVNTSDVTNADIISMMFGETQIRRRPDTLKAQDEIVMDVQGLCRKGKFQDVSFQLHRGEVLGIAGMLGAGRTELLKSLFGADPYDAGSITVNSTQAPHRASPIKMKKLGLGLTPENRKEEGLILIHSIRDNLCYASMDKTSNGWLEIHKKRVAAADKQVGELQIKIPDIEAPVSSLSGGNQQKVVVGKWLARESRVVIFDEPTRGIDVAAKVEIYNLMNDLKKQGISVIFVSSEMPEVLGIADRIIVMCDGRITGEMMVQDATQEKILELATRFENKIGVDEGAKA